MAIVSLLAGAAQAGAGGVLCQAALNLTKAGEVRQKAAQLRDDDERKQRAQALFEQTRDVFLQLAADQDALAEAKQDIINSNGRTYQP